MREVRYLITCFIAVFILAGCNGMDSEPTNSYISKSFWASIDKAQYILNMAYNQLYSVEKMWQDEALSDNVSQGRGFVDQRTIRNGIANPATSIFASEWNNLYGGIKTMRVILENTDNLNITGAVENDMRAQAWFIRASLFFRLTNFYGDIPFFAKDITLEEANTISHTPRAKVIEFIHQKLDGIMQYLPTRDRLSVEENGKITQTAALMLQTYVCLYDNDWANVEKYTGQIMGGSHGTYKLFPSFNGLFESENEYNSEVIMDCVYIPSTHTWSEMDDMAPLSKDARVISTAPTQGLVDDFITLDGDPISSSKTYNEARPYVSRDPRLTGTIIYGGYDWSGGIKDGSVGGITHTNPKKSTPDGYKGLTGNSSAAGYYVRRHYDKYHEVGVAPDLNVITMRYADVLLMYAEAMNEQGKMTAEVWNKTIRPIRERVGFMKPKALNFPTRQSRTEMCQTLRIERRSELALGGLRWFDVKRWRAGIEYLNGYMHSARYGANSIHIRLDSYQFLDTRDYLWSVPQSQVDINPNLKSNNPGYAS